MRRLLTALIAMLTRRRAPLPPDPFGPAGEAPHDTRTPDSVAFTELPSNWLRAG